MFKCGKCIAFICLFNARNFHFLYFYTHDYVFEFRTATQELLLLEVFNQYSKEVELNIPHAYDDDSGWSEQFFRNFNH